VWYILGAADGIDQMKTRWQQEVLGFKLFILFGNIYIYMLKLRMKTGSEADYV
jgi:hypothetical protein